MSIKISENKEIIVLETKNTEYVISIFDGRFPLHTYYGDKTDRKFEFKSEIRSFAPFYEKYGLGFLPDTVKFEFPFYGDGDFRASALKLRDLSTGSDVTHFEFEDARVINGIAKIDGLPQAEGEDAETLEMVLFDEVTSTRLKLYYTLFPECDVIARHFTLENVGKKQVKIEKCMSFCLDIPRHDLDMISFYGWHANEQNYERKALRMGNQSIFSRRGASSHMFNPFFMLCDRNATEEDGEAYGFNLVYSGSFLNEAETDQMGFTRVLGGLGSESFSYLLESGESFTSPEAVMSYSSKGIGRISNNMHRFVKQNIMPKEKKSVRPVVLNSWEAFYFNIDEKIMTDFAMEAKAVGFDTVVMDDGWFGSRTNDKKGLGDWWENPDRFKDGLKSFVEKIVSLGIDFGIWIEPEMVNPDSELFRKHPEWINVAPDREALLSRNQFVLDFANEEVRNYLKESLKKTLKGLPISYVKWDFNRHLSQVYSRILPPERQGEAQFRYMLGVYEFYDWFVKEFPFVTLENCSGGGGRYDLGMMKYSSQIWTSDQTNPVRRSYIQCGASYGYPTATMSCHVANGGNLTEDPRKLDYAFQTATNGVLGYELNILNSSNEAKKTFSEQIKLYRKRERLIVDGEFHRVFNTFETGRYCYYFINDKKNEILLTFLQPTADGKTDNIVRVSFADESKVYVDEESGEKFSGRELINGIVITTDDKDYFAKTLSLKAK